MYTVDAVHSTSSLPSSSSPAIVSSSSPAPSPVMGMIGAPVVSSNRLEGRLGRRLLGLQHPVAVVRVADPTIDWNCRRGDDAEVCLVTW